MKIWGWQIFFQTTVSFNIRFSQVTYANNLSLINIRYRTKYQRSIILSIISFLLNVSERGNLKKIMDCSSFVITVPLFDF